MANRYQSRAYYCIGLLCVLSLIALLIPLDISAAEESEDETYLAYNGLTEREQSAYNKLHNAVKNNQSASDFGNLTKEEGWKAWDAFEGDHPEYFWFNDCYSFYYYTETGHVSEFRYTPTISASDRAIMQSKIDEAVASIELDQNGDDYQNIKKIHSWMCKKITYKDGVHDNVLYNALVEGKAVCEGYAMAFSYLTHLCGINCLYITGYTYSSDTIGQAWNLVQLEGKWYFVDVTWDDDGNHGDREYFLIGSETRTYGGKFASEDHLADTLYGVTPASGKYFNDEEVNRNRIILGIAAIIIVALVIFKIYRKRKAKQMIAGTRAIRYGNACPQCGSVLNDSDMFCTKCGTTIERDTGNSNDD